MGKCVFKSLKKSKNLGIKGVAGGRTRAGTRVGTHSPGGRDVLGPTGPSAGQPGPPEAAGRARECGQSATEKSRRCTRGEAARPERLALQIPGGVLKSGYPGSDGEPGCGCRWLPSGCPGGGPRLPGAPWRAGQRGSFFVRTLKIYRSYPGNPVRGRPLRAPPPVLPRGSAGLGQGVGPWG